MTQLISTIQKFIGLSTDPKPSRNDDRSIISPGSEYFETDTYIRYVFDGIQWNADRRIDRLPAEMLLEQQKTNEFLELMLSKL